MATRRARVPAVCHLINVSAMFLSLILAFLTELFWRRGLSVDSWAASTKKYFAIQMLYLILLLKNIGLRSRF